MQYIKRTLNYGIKYNFFLNGQILYGYFNANWAKNKDTKDYTSNYYFILTKGVIH
jgi:gamma-glutamylcysteine synthetase